MSHSSARLAAAIVAVAVTAVLGIFACRAYEYQRCVDKVNVFLSSPIGQLDAYLLGGAASWRTSLIGECHAKYGS